MELTYKLTFLSDWHCGSGLSGGAEADATVIKDSQNLPYIPGKTIKGLLKEALEEMQEIWQQEEYRKQVDQLLGYELKDPSGQKVIDTISGSAFFSNAILPDKEKKEITPETSPFLYRVLASQKMEAKGISKQGSLRELEVCIPLTLEGKIMGIATQDQFDLVTKALQWVRHLGVNRNRGLGRCRFEITPKQN